MYLFGHFISQERADLLNSRFHIVKLDEEETGVTAEMEGSNIIYKEDISDDNPKPAKRPKLVLELLGLSDKSTF